MITAIRPTERTSERPPAPAAGWARTPSSAAPQDRRPRVGERTGRFGAGARSAAAVRRASSPAVTTPAAPAPATAYVVDPHAVAAALVERLLAGGALRAGTGRE
jgi:hypothetical protein